MKQAASGRDPDTLRSHIFTSEDIYLFNEGSHYRLYEKMGAYLTNYNGEEGAAFAVWAPNARQVSVIGDFNGWDRQKNLLAPQAESGIWQGFIPDVKKGQRYKYQIVSRNSDYIVEKADPLAIHAETPPYTASIIWDLNYDWQDGKWIQERRAYNALNAPWSIYELHAGSWRRKPDNQPLSYREMAPELTEYIQSMGFTHVEFLPLMEHPFYGSWGYQITGFFAPTSRYGTPQDFMYLIDYLHRNGIGVILDWVPSHFPTDAHGLGYFDGTHLYEHADSRLGFHPDWNTFIFNYGRHEVSSFLISSAIFWLDKYHADALRFDGIASMLYRDYSRKEGEWIPNENGGRENLEAVVFLRHLNEAVYKNFPDVQTIAEESTSWPMVSRPTYAGGLGFGAKWDMGWMHDTLAYMKLDPVQRKFYHNKLTFRAVYAYSENFVLPLSHDEVVYGNASLLSKMPGDDWQKFANLRVLLGYMFTVPGKKLLFMGGEFGQWQEWNHDRQLDWSLLQYGRHQELQKWVADLNRLYREEPALHELDFEAAGFEWIESNDFENSVISFIRKGKAPGHYILVVCNFTPVPHWHYRLGVPVGGHWKEVLNGDSKCYGGSGMGISGGLISEPISSHYRPATLDLTLPPLSILILRNESLV
jgi:1,4-alpha-glucan branching enzyme